MWCWLQHAAIQPDWCALSTETTIDEVQRVPDLLLAIKKDADDGSPADTR